MINADNINHEHKDRLFNFIFGRDENREWTLSLYNAVNGSDYTDASLIEFNILNDALFLKVRNDTSFIISNTLSVYEHQSTYNPNMPLRMMDYVGRLYTGYISRRGYNRYGTILIPLPIPKLVVFYNELKDTDDEVILRLSDSFEESHRSEADIEVRVRMLNINHGKNRKIMDACAPLAEYAWFIDRIRVLSQSMDMEHTVRRAIDEMPETFGIREFLQVHRAEVEGMIETEYSEEEIRELFKADGRREGIQEGIALGRQEMQAKYEELEAENKRLNEELERVRQTVNP